MCLLGFKYTGKAGFVVRGYLLLELTSVVWKKKYTNIQVHTPFFKSEIPAAKFKLNNNCFEYEVNPLMHLRLWMLVE